MQPAANTGSSDARADDAREIAGIATAMAQAWNGGDGAAYAALFTEDCDYVAFDGTHLKGRQATISICSTRC